MNKIPMLERFAAQSLVDHGGELIFSKEKFAQLVAKECMTIAQEYDGAKLGGPGLIIAMRIEQHFGVEE